MENLIVLKVTLKVVLVCSSSDWQTWIGWLTWILSNCLRMEMSVNMDNLHNSLKSDTESYMSCLLQIGKLG